MKLKEKHKKITEQKEALKTLPDSALDPDSLWVDSE